MTIEALEKLFKGKDKNTTIVLARDPEGRAGFSPLSVTAPGNFEPDGNNPTGTFVPTPAGGDAFALYPLG